MGDAPRARAIPGTAASIGVTSEFSAAVGFLTRIPTTPGAPLPATHDGSTPVAASGAAAFGLVGALIGVVAGAPVLVLAPEHPMLAAIVVVAIVAVLDGGLHLDGLADTWDALAAGPTRAETARTDPRSGSAGVVAIVLVLGLEIAALAELAAGGPLVAFGTVIAAAAVSRAAAPAWAVLVGRRQGRGGGLGRWFASTTGPASAVIAGVSAILVVGLVGLAVDPRIAVAAVAGTVAGSLLTAFVIRARRQLDGDGYGFAIEATFALVLGAGALVA
jgi:adenosylcobinamide-GDP ribazoletransferase